MPFTKLQVTMGIPLYKIPQIRPLYDEEDIYGDDKIDFLEEDYKDIKRSTIHASITLAIRRSNIWPK